MPQTILANGLIFNGRVSIVSPRASTSQAHLSGFVSEPVSKREVGCDIHQGGEKSKEEGIEEIADVEEPDNLNSIAASNLKIHLRIQIQNKKQVRIPI